MVQLKEEWTKLFIYLDLDLGELCKFTLHASSSSIGTLFNTHISAQSQKIEQRSCSGVSCNHLKCFLFFSPGQLRSDSGCKGDLLLQRGRRQHSFCSFLQYCVFCSHHNLTRKIGRWMNVMQYITQAHITRLQTVFYCTLTNVWLLDSPLGRKIMSPFLVTVDIICSICPCALIGQRLSDEFSLDVGWLCCEPISWSVSKWIWDVELFKATLAGKCLIFNEIIKRFLYCIMTRMDLSIARVDPWCMLHMWIKFYI